MKQSIGEWYSGRSILITGGTGFMGKVLVEKLLRSCSRVERVYILIRQKRGVNAARRVQQMITLPLFDRLQTENPNVFSKLVGIDGDLTQPGLGLSDANRRLLTSKVSIVFHGAASLRLEAGLKDAILYNTIPTERVLELAKEMPLLEAFIHLSTAFCHCEEEVLEEKTYVPHQDPKDIITITQFLDETSLELITPRLLGKHPNSYTYSKRLSETLVEQHSGNIPATIVRPSIVLPTIREPMPGWVDTLNGPIGVMVGAGKGVIRTMMCGADYNAEVIPVDIAINCLICIAWQIGTQKPAGLPVYNVSQSNIVSITWGEILERGRKMIYDYPFYPAAWYPDGEIRTNRSIHNLLVILLHIIPAYFIDFMMLLMRQKRFMVHVQKRISVGLEVLQYFTMRQWNFKNDSIVSLTDAMTDEDKQIFYMANAADDFDVDKYLLDCILGARVYCMKEPLTTLPRARRHMTMLYFLDRFVAYSLYALMGWFLYKILMSVNSFIV